MSTVKDYAPEQWKTIVSAPAAAGLLVTLADASGPIGVAREGMAVVRAITDSAAVDAPEVVRSLAQEVSNGAIRPDLPELPMSDRAAAKAVLLETIKAATAAVETTSPTEAAGFRSWLVATASRVAHASKEGGFLGFGGIQVSADEQAAIDELAAALGVSAPAPPLT